jgi:hypothetical protein
MPGLDMVGLTGDLYTATKFLNDFKHLGGGVTQKPHHPTLGKRWLDSIGACMRDYTSSDRAGFLYWRILWA